MITIPLIAADGSRSTVVLPDPVGGTAGVRNISIGQSIILDTVLSTTNMSVSSATLTDPNASWRSISIYCAAPAGQVYLAVYDNSGSGGGPGKRIAVSAVFTPVFGWNTVPLPVVAAPPGTYYLGYVASSGNFKTLQAASGGSTCYASYVNFGQPPATWPSGSSTVQYLLDVYATLSTTTPQPVLPHPSPTLSGGVISTGLQSWQEINDPTLWPQLGSVTHLGYYRLHSGALTNMTATLQQPTADQVWGHLLSLGVKTMVSCHPHDVSGTPTSASVNGLISLILTRYGPGGTYWRDNPSAPNIPIEVIEVCNEPNAYFSGSNAAKAAAYGTILVNAYTLIKASWPTVAVAGVAMGDGQLWGSNLVNFLAPMFQAVPAAATSMDIYTFHPYIGQTNTNWGPADQYITWSPGPNPTGAATNPGARLDLHVAQTRQVLTQYGVPASVPMWNSEDGYPLAGPDHGGQGQFNSGSYATVTPFRQAAYQVRMAVCCARLNIARCYHFNTVDADGFDAGFFQLTGSGSSPKEPWIPRPQAIALGWLNTLIGAATSITTVTENWGGGNPFVYKFAFADGHTVQVAWAQTPQTAAITVTGTTTVTDMLGNTIASPSAGSYQSALSETPVWIASK